MSAVSGSSFHGSNYSIPQEQAPAPASQSANPEPAAQDSSQNELQGSVDPTLKLKERQTQLQGTLNGYTVKLSASPPTPRPLALNEGIKKQWVDAHRGESVSHPQVEEKYDEPVFGEVGVEDKEDDDWDEVTGDLGTIEEESEPTPPSTPKHVDGWKGTEETHKAASTLAENFRVIPFGEFKQGLRSVTKAFNEEMKTQFPSEKYVVIVDSPHLKKSSSWVTEHAFSDLNPQPTDIICEKDLSQFLKDHPDVKHVARFDDAIYSGKQMAQYANTINKAFKETNREGHFHVINPFFTTAGLARVESQSTLTMPVHIAGRSQMVAPDSPHRMKSVFETIRDPSLEKTIRSMYPKTGDVQGELMGEIKDAWEGVVMLAFQHKLPDFVSTIANLQEGRVLDDRGNCKVNEHSEPVKHCWIQPFTPIYKEG